MARYIGPKTKIARKFGEAIFGDDKSLEKRNYPPGPKLEGFIFKIFHIPDAEVIIFWLHSNSQNKKIRVFVFFKILVNPVISSPALDAPINFKSKEIVTHCVLFADL